MKLSGGRFAAKRYEKLLADFTQTEEQFGIARFFHGPACTCETAAAAGDEETTGHEETTEEGKKTEDHRAVDEGFLHAQRIKRVAVVSGTASTITSQCVSLAVTALGAVALAVVTYGDDPWFAGSLALAAVTIVLLGVLLRRGARNNLRSFGMGLRGFSNNPLAGKFGLNTVGPYVAVQLAVVGYAAAVGVVF